MINLISIPQRSNNLMKLKVDGDVLTITLNGVEEVFDFTGLTEGKMIGVETDNLSINPVLSAEKTGDTVNVEVLQFYSLDEKELFENGDN